jgi:hypothetical protein
LTVRKDSVAGRGGEISIINYAASTVGNEAALNFGIENSTYAGDDNNAQIKARLTNSNGAADMIFSTWSGSAFGERMKIDSTQVKATVPFIGNSGTKGFGGITTTTSTSTPTGGSSGDHYYIY